MSDLNKPVPSLTYKGDTAWLINLDKDTQKLEEATMRLEKVGFIVKRVPGIPCEPKIIRQDLWLLESNFIVQGIHQRLIEEAMERGDPHVWIFEDDVMLRDDAANIMDNIVKELIGKKWDMFYLGACIEKYPERRGKNIARVWGACGHAHAYCVRQQAFQKAIDSIKLACERRDNYPDQYSENLEKYIAEPILAIQDPKYKDRLYETFRVHRIQDFIDHCDELRQNYIPNFR